LNYKGACLIRIGRYDEAITVLDKAISINPKKTLSKLNKAVSLVYLDRDKEAWNIVNELSLKPDHYDLFKFKVLHLIHKKKYEEALAVTNKGISIYSTNKDIFMRLKKQCLIRLERYDEASNIVDNSQRENPDYYYKQAVHLWEKRLFKKSWQLIEQALSLNPNHQKSLGGKSSLLLVDGKEEEANLIFDKALKAGDAPANLWYGRALAYMVLKRHE